MCLQVFVPVIMAPGIEYTQINAITFSRWSHVHVFRINPQQNRLDLIMATDLGKNQASIKDFAENSHALIAVNGGFFDQQGKPLGLRIVNSRQRHPLKPISWWGVFYIKNQHHFGLILIHLYIVINQLDFR